MRGDRRQHLRHLEVRMAGEEVDHAEELEPLPLYRAHPAALLARRLRGEPGVGTFEQRDARVGTEVECGPVVAGHADVGHEIGRATRRESACQSVSLSVVAVPLKKKKE